jgi:hypothetical protein
MLSLAFKCERAALTLKAAKAVLAEKNALAVKAAMAVLAINSAKTGTKEYVL